MSEAALFIGWNRPVVGRETQAANFWKESLNFYTTLQKEGTIESYEPVLLTANGGTMNGFFLLRGNQNKLDALQHDERYLDFTIKANVLLENFSAVPAWVDKGLEKVIARYTMLAAKI